MKCQKKFEKEIYVHPIGDVHIGSSECDIQSFRKYVQKIRELPANHRVILLGDIIENATRYSVGDGVYAQKYYPDAQLDQAVEILKPIRARIDGMVSGNHENRTKKEVGLDLSRVLADRLKIRRVYDPAQVLVQYTVDGVEFLVFAFHGAGGGGTIGSIITKSIKRKEIFDQADLYLSGHVHIKASYIGSKTRVQGGKIYRDHQAHIITGSYLEYGGYGAEAGYTPQANGMTQARLYVENGTKKIEVTI